MELKAYLNILLKKWWIVIPIFLITVTAAVVITYTQTPIYSSSTTYVVAPSASLGDSGSYAAGLNILSNREAIASTYAEVIISEKILKMAAESLALESTRGYSISGDLLRGTNVLKITVTGPNPEVARDLANAVGSVTAEYVKDLYEIYDISPLDEARTPRSPISPNKRRDISLAIILGLILGGGVAFLVEYLEPLPKSIFNVSIIDTETGAYNKQYFLQRLGEEMVRAKRNHYPLSIALMRIKDFDLLQGANLREVYQEALRHIAILVKQYIRDEDLLAYTGDDTFAFLLLDTPGSNAQAIMEYVQARIAWMPFQSKIIDTTLNLQGAAGIVTYDHNGTGRDQLMDMALQALELAEVNENGKIYLNNPETKSAKS